MLEVHKQKLINTILILSLIFWFSALITVFIFYLRLTKTRKVRSAEKSSQTSQTSSPPPFLTPTPTPPPLAPDKVTFDPINGDVFNLSLPIKSVNKNNQLLTLSYQGKLYSYKYTTKTQFLIISQGKSQRIPFQQAEKYLLSGTKVKLAAKADKTIETLIIYPNQ